MRVKRYLVDSMPDALEKIRIDLGKDAVILNTKPVKTGGFLGLFSKRQIEVIAAVEAKQATEAKRPEQAPAINKFAAKQAYQRTNQKVASETGIEQTQQGAGAVHKMPTVPPPVPQPPSAQESNLNPSGEAVVPSPPKADVRPKSVPDAAPVPKLAEGEIAQELRDMREVFQKLLLKQDGHQMLPEAFGNIRDRLTGQEIQEEGIIFILQELAKRIGDASTVSDEQVIVVTKEIIQEQLASVTRTSPRIGRDVKYAFFFGPTGVGKTTTIAKLAADAMLKERRKVGFITTDTFRIGAVEQLKTYANILNVPIEVVFSAKDLTASMEKLAHCDLIFVDTAGRNFRNSEYVQGIAALVEQGASSENYLVLSLTSRYNDMKTIIDNFQDVPIQKVIFTKADETMVYGSILNVARSFEIPLSYITVGQNVPDDIVSASPEVVSKLIVGEERYA